MAKILRIAVLSAVLASSAVAIKASAAPPLELLAVTASSLGQKALDDPDAFAFVELLTTEIGQRLAGTEAHKRAVAWAEDRLRQAGFETRTLRTLHLPCLGPRRGERGGRRSGIAASRHYNTGRSGSDGCQRHRGRDRALPKLCGPVGGTARIACRQDRGGDAAHGAGAGRQRLRRCQPDPSALAPRRPPNAARSPICCARSALTAIACRIPALSTTKMARRGFRRRHWPFRTPSSSSG